MIAILLGILSISLALLALTLQRFYSSVPSRELKRLAGRGDQLAKALYRAVGHGTSLRVFLWLAVATAMPLGFVLIVPRVPGWLAFLVLAFVLFVAFVWIPSLRLSVHTAQFAAALAGPVAAIVQRLHVVLDATARMVNAARELHHHSRLYEKDDLTGLLRRQKDQVDNRISLEDLELTHRALQFSDTQAADIARPRKHTHPVDADDSIGPILLDHLHKSGQQSFLVYKGQPENIVGSLLMRDAVAAKQGGKVSDLVRSDLCYVHEDFSLRQVLAAFQKTGHHTAVVINGFEEFVGIITLDRLLTELVGEAAADDRVNYENREAIAAYKPAAAPDAGTSQDGQSETTLEPLPEPDDTPDEDEPAPASPEATEVIK